MKKTDIKEIQNKSAAELKKQLADARKGLFDLRMEHAQNKLKNTRSLFLKRKEIARVLTALQRKEQANA